MAESQRRAPAALLALLIATTVGSVLGGTVMYVAWQHNPQGEFHEAGVVHWGDWLAVGAVYFLLAFVPGSIIAAMIHLKMRRGSR